jgi:hypothetical protein
VFELIREMARLAPRCSSCCYAGAVMKKSPNSTASTSSAGDDRSAPGQPPAGAAAARLLPLLPAPLRRFAGRKAFAVVAARDEHRFQFLRGLDADLLFCPFTAPV